MKEGGRAVLFGCVTLGCMGCAGCVPSPWAEYYQPFPEQRQCRMAPCTSVRMIQRERIDPNIFFELFEEGYVPVGYIEFNGTENYLDEKAIRQQAEAHSACVCYYTAHYSHMESGVDISSGLPTTSAAPGGGSGGTPALSPLQLAARQRPMFNYLAVFGVRDTSDYCLELLAMPAPAPYREKLKTDAGMVVVALRKGGLAERSGILRGDVLVQLDGKPVTQELLRRWRPEDTPASVELYRDGKQARVSIHR